MGGGGRFIFWWGAEGLLATAVAILLTVFGFEEAKGMGRDKPWQAT